MTNWIETYRGTVPPWECDVTEHFTIARRKSFTVHAKWIGRYSRRGFKLQHASGQSI